LLKKKHIEILCSIGITINAFLFAIGWFCNINNLQLLSLFNAFSFTIGLLSAHYMEPRK
jgi:hypothetical protein